MKHCVPPADIVMLGTFAAWNLGTIQARALPLATGLRSLGIRASIVTTPWDLHSESGVIETIDGVPIINTRSLSPANPVGAVREQLAWVDRLNPQLVHVFKPKGFGGLSGRLLSGSRTVLVDSDDWEGDGGWNELAGYSLLQRRVFAFQETDLLRRAHHVTAASTLLAERARAVRDAASDETVHALPNGLRSDWFARLAAARTRQPSQINPPVIVLYSRFAEFDSDWLARFANHLASIFTGRLTIRVVGDASSQNLPPLGNASISLDLMGYVASGRIPSLLAGATVAVYPYTDALVTRSKQSVKLLEQMAAGCPVIASDVGDIARTLGPAGVVLPTDQPEVFASEVVALLAQPERLDTMSALARQRVEQHFGFDNLTRQLLAVYQTAGLR